MIKYLSLFSGIGGFEIGIQNATQHIRRIRGGDSSLRNMPDTSNSGGRWTPPTCVGYSEIDEPAIKTYEEHFEHENFGDITTINPEELPDFDLVVGGFPCQAFSVAGKRRGFDDTRGTLFFDIARILKEKRPRHLVLENVKGLLSHDGGKTFQTILGVLADLGYRVEWQVLNSKHFGVPQNRERIYIIGHLRDECRQNILPISGENQAVAIPSSNATQESQKFIKTRHLSQNGGLISPSTTLQATEIPHVIDTETAYSLKASDYKKTGSDFVNKSQGNFGIVNGRIRRLTPIECERLQGFPDDWTLGSNTQRYKQCGNAVTTNVVEAVMTKLLHDDHLHATFPITSQVKK